MDLKIDESLLISEEYS